MTKHRSARTLLALAAATAVALAGGGCNTVEGVGKDLQALGKGASSTARNTSDTLSGKK